MNSAPFSRPRWPSLLNELYTGRVRWDLLRPFPRQQPSEREAADRAAAGITQLLRDRVNPTEVDRAGQFPADLLDALQEAGYLKLMIAPGLGGLGLSPYGAARVIEAAASWSAAVGMCLGIGNGFGSGSYLGLLPDGPLREMIAGRVTAGIISAGADAEAIGTANQRRSTTAVPTDDGKAYLVTGEKVFIGNGPVADLMDVSATVIAPDGTPDIRLFFVDSRSQGFSVKAWQEFMGLRGAPIGVLHLDAVQVRAEHMLAESSNGWRMRPGARDAGRPETAENAADGPAFPADLAHLATLGRILTIAPTALAIAKLCLLWSKEFSNRRRIDDRGLADYEEIQRRIAESAADVFAIQSVAEWVLLAQDRADTQPDLTSAKNLASLACWRTADRTMSLLGGEGYETAPSKTRRGVPPLPVERAYRDARALRIAGGVDFLLDKWSAESSLSTCYYPSSDGAGDADDAGRAIPETSHDDALSPRCQDHLRFLSAESRAFAERCRRLAATIARDELPERQRTLIGIGRIGNELLQISVVLARAADLASQGNVAALDLADICCTASRRRLSRLCHQLEQPDGPDYARVCGDLLHGSGHDFLLADVITDTPPAA
jgi:alkylation response protein AidB-like acyl-CoA dehydrogenase